MGVATAPVDEEGVITKFFKRTEEKNVREARDEEDPRHVVWGRRPRYRVKGLGDQALEKGWRIEGPVHAGLQTALGYGRRALGARGGPGRGKSV